MTMDEFAFTDALTGARVALDARGGVLSATPGRGARACPSLFFPGCSLLSYAPPLVSCVASMLEDTGLAQGLSPLCCGRILDFEPDGAPRRAAFERRLREAVATAGTRRVIAACPNCAEALIAALARDERTAEVEVAPLSQVLAERGWHLDGETVARLVATKRAWLAAEHGEEAAPAGEAPVATGDAPAAGEAPLWLHCSCPDREMRLFAQGVRDLCPPGMLRNVALSSMGCCGSRARARGRDDVAARQGAQRAEEARGGGARALVTACMSCAASLAVSQDAVPVFHYLELLCDWPIDWRTVGVGLRCRFLIEDGCECPAAGRAFISLGREGGEAL